MCVLREPCHRSQADYCAHNSQEACHTASARGSWGCDLSGFGGPRLWLWLTVLCENPGQETPEGPKRPRPRALGACRASGF